MAGCNIIPSVIVSRDIAWCFTPFFTWMRILGIELNLTLPKNGAKTLYGLLILLFVIWINIDITRYTFWALSLPSTDQHTMNISSSTLSWNMQIDNINSFFLVTFIWPATFYVAHFNWPCLWNVVRQFDEPGCSCKLNHRHLRKLLRLGFIPIILEISLVIYSLAGDSGPFLANISVYRKCAYFIGFFSPIFPLSSLVLYCSIAWLISMYYENIHQNIEHSCDRTIKQETIRRWKRSLVLASESVNQMNRCFGMILLIFINYSFVDFITKSFFLLNGTEVTSLTGTIFMATYMITKFIYLFFVAYTPTKIRNQAISVATLLRKVKSDDEHLQHQVSLLASTTLQTLPTITALGYFDVSLRLIPKLIGTTLTYLIILFQFHSSEK